MNPIRVTVWGENIHDRRDVSVRAIYPNGMHTEIANAIREGLGADADVRTTTLEQPECGLSTEVLDNTDVLTWWGHAAHDEVSDSVVTRVHERVLRGMGLLVLHSAHHSRVFKSLMGTSCDLRWRSGDDRELVWTVDPGHPIAKGVPPVISIERQEMYGEYFDIPPPDEIVFLSTFTGGEVFRSGCCFRRGRGRIFFFSPGDQEYPVYHQPEVRLVISNAARWAYPPGGSIPSPYRLTHSPQGWIDESVRRR